MYKTLPSNQREWERALLLPFQSVIVLVFPIFTIVASLNPPCPGYGYGEAAVASYFVPACFLSCIVLLVSGLIQLYRGIFGQVDKVYLRRYAYINFGFVVFGVIITLHLLSCVFVR